MVNKNVKYTTGDILTESTTDAVILQPLSAFDETDEGGVSIATTSYVDKKTISVSADAISNYVLIQFCIDATAQYGTSYTYITGYGKVQIDGVDVSFERSLYAGAAEHFANKVVRHYTYKYVPTTLQKSTGFDITIQGKFTKGGPGGTAGSTSIGGFGVWGA